jgi:hypothetical protein
MDNADARIVWGPICAELCTCEFAAPYNKVTSLYKDAIMKKIIPPSRKNVNGASSKTVILILTIPQNEKAPKNLSGVLFAVYYPGITSDIRLFKVKNGQMVKTNPG